MRKKYLVLIIALVLPVCFFASNVNAWSQNYDNASDCLRDSGGRDNIASVQWACSWAGYSTEATCALWIGASNDSVDPTIYTDNSSGNVTIRYYRMCYNGWPMGTSAIWVENDNGAIDDSKNMNGGDWGSPKYINTTLDINKFTSGINGNNKTINNRVYKEYKRTVTVWRRSANATYCDQYDGACSHMDETVILRIRQKATLSGEAVDKNGNKISGLSIDSKTVYSGDKATITRKEKADWTFLGWRANKTSGTPSGGANYSVDILTSNKTVYAVYEYKSFQAEAKASSTTTGYVGDDKSVDNAANCTDTSKGCNTTFVLNMKRIAGSGESKYSIQKSVNSNGFTNVESNKSFNPSKNNEGQQIITRTESIKPGESVCYRLIFHPFGKYDSNTTKSVTACAYKTGTFGSSISMKIKNNNEDENSYNFYSSGALYVKPGDMVNLRGSYTPTVQYVANLNPAELIVGNKSNKKSGAVKDRFSTLASPGWNNAFSIQLNSIEMNSCPGSFGSASSYECKYDYKVESGDVGETLIATALTNIKESTKTTPKSASITYVSGTGTSIKVDKSNLSSNTSNIKVPYNFELSTTIGNEDQNNNEKKIVYAGEGMDIKYTVTVNPRRNEIVRGETYSTIVRSAKSKIQIYSGGEWTDVDDSEKGHKTMNETENPEDDSITSIAAVIIPDITAGETICLRSAVSPADSGNFDNINQINYNWSWKYSDQTCFVVAKKPSLQVWGGNIYSDGNITTGSTTKKIEVNSKTDNYTFGSWGELGIISGGAVTGMASGAGYGYSGLDFAAKPGGAKGSDFCEASPLSFANNDCQNEETGSLDISFGGLSNDSDFITQALANENANIRNRYSSFSDFESDFKDGEIDSGTVFISNPDNDIDIDDNVKYTGSYISLDSMPKVVIYAKNVNIFCNVLRIDALIIAKGTVNTCSNGGHINSKDRSNQLIINGAIIAKELEAGRTYGAGAGTDPETGNNYSIIPAEIINFDPSLYLWGGKEVNVDANTSLKNSYVRELSPRY